MPAGSHVMGPAEWGLLLLLSLVWGGSFFFVGVAVEELPTLTIVAARVGLAALTLWAVLALTGRRMPVDARIWAAFVCMGLLNNVIPFSLIVWGQGHIASGVASILNATTPLFTVVIAHFLTADERLSTGRVAGVLLGLAGVAVLIGPAALADLGVHVLAQLAILLAATSYGFASIFGRRFRTMGVTPLQTATGQVTGSSLLLVPMAALVDTPWTLAVPGTPTLLAVVALAVVSTAFAYILYFRILATAGATNIMLVTFLVPVSAILLGSLFLQEAILPRQYGGMALIGLGLAAIDGRLLTRLRARVA